MRLIILMGIFSLFSCHSSAQRVNSNTYSVTLKTLLTHSVPEISVDRVKDQLSSYEHILDTREVKEYNVSQLRDAEFIGYDDFELIEVDHIDKNAKILLYCSVGYRSEKIAEKMQKAGFTDVTNLYGGIFEWKNQEQTVVDSTGAVTDRIHAFDKLWGRFLQKGEKVY